jgi:hypothetical protein
MTGLYILRNPHQALWGTDQPEICPAGNLGDLDGPVMLFIHGLQYGSAGEVVRDLIRPFELGAGLYAKANGRAPHCLFFHWPSALDLTDGRSAAQFLKAVAWQPPRLLDHISAKLSEAEFKAGLAGFEFADVCAQLFERGDRPEPLVVTHSLGAHVWAQFVQQQVLLGRALPNIGQWWSLQPAIPWSALQTGGDFELCGDLYAAEPQRKLLWYSSFDMVLATLYYLAKRERAMGQVGAPYLAVEQRNLARYAGEAHGTTALRPSTFFCRVKDLIRSKVAELSATHPKLALAG